MEDAALPSVDRLAGVVHARAPEAVPDALLRTAIELGRELSGAGDALIERFVAQARDAGVSWTEVGALFGTSKQAAQKRYGAVATRPGAWPGRWTPAAQHALNRAGEEAQGLGHNYVGTEHALLALLDAHEGPAAHALADLGVTRERVLAQDCLEQRGPLDHDCLGVMPRFKHALEHARRIDGALGHQVANTEHLLAGIVAVPDALAVEILGRHGVSADDVRAALARRLQIDPAQLVVARARRRRLLARRVEPARDRPQR